MAEPRKLKDATRATEPDWATLVRAARTGEASHLSALIEAAQPRLYRFCMFLTGERNRAEDLCQEAFVRALENLKKLRDPTQFLSWLFKTAKNHYLDQKRAARNRESETLDGFGEEEGQIARPEVLRQEAKQEGLAQVHEALAKLDPEERTVLLLVDMEERSYQEAAEIIGISEAALRSRLHRARQAFEKKFSA